MHHEQYSLLTSTDHICAQELKAQELQRHHCALENSSVIWSAHHVISAGLFHIFSFPVYPQHEAPTGQHDLLQDDTVHRALLQEPIQSTSCACEPLSHVNYESGRNPRNTCPTNTPSHTDTLRHTHTQTQIHKHHRWARVRRWSRASVSDGSQLGRFDDSVRNDHADNGRIQAAVRSDVKANAFHTLIQDEVDALLEVQAGAF